MAKNDKSFKPGQSGNPGGRPGVVKEIQELAQEHCAAAIDRLKKIAENPKTPPAVVVSACNALLDRGIGKPIQTVDSTINDRRLNYVVSWKNPEERDAKIKEHIGAGGGPFVSLPTKPKSHEEWLDRYRPKADA